MNAPSPTIEAAPIVDVFTGTSFSVDEILMGRNVINNHVRALKDAQAEKSIAGMKDAAEKIATVTGQLNILSAHLAKILTQHTNRKPRV